MSRTSPPWVMPSPTSPTPSPNAVGAVGHLSGGCLLYPTEYSDMANEVAIVVTGIGATSPLGGDAETTWTAALAGTSGVATMEHEWVEEYDLPVKFAGELAVKPEEVLPRPQIRRMDPSAQYAVIAAKEAWEDAGAPEMDGERLGSVIASGIGGVWTLLSSWDTLKESGPRRVLPLTVPMLMPNSPAAYVSLEIGAKAGAHTPVSACASGAEAIGYAVDMIRSGRADAVVAGGTEDRKSVVEGRSVAGA